MGCYLFDCGVVYSGLVDFGCWLCIWLMFVFRRVIAVYCVIVC